MKVHLILVLATTLVFGLSQAGLHGLKDLENNECLVMANVPKEDIRNFAKKWTAPPNRDAKCSLAYCLMIDRKAIKEGNSSIDYDYLRQQLKPDELKEIIPQQGVDDIIACANPPAVIDFCDNAFDLTACILKNTKKYFSPLTESDDEALHKCKDAETIEGDKLQSSTQEIPKARRGKCMMACLLRERGAVTKDGKLDVPYLYKKILNDLPLSLTTEHPESKEDFKKCSPNATDPTGSKDVCLGAFDLYNCLLITAAKYSSGIF